ncbi:hypothetical protein SH601_02075 [Gracilibacillus sp. S3-1-1]|uniref:Uncharacterized protein n=1 Tax=Gracilibacillus pellucidus TaxID=3095368 RepID=A0ACC6M1I3_9BACI|nr:hypothetical protein [Gracilibacillus sp. S3-1-1]MDX8044761.1 hypothetical protein [Gracilibacillus sp. S3-1-1]
MPKDTKLGKEKFTKRHKLTIKNYTHDDVEGFPGFTFRLIWTRDVHQEYDETPRLEPQQEDTKKSRGIGNGGNKRHFDVEVRLLTPENEDLYVGFFTHDFIAPPGDNGQKHDTLINFDVNTWNFYRKYMVIENETPTEKIEIIGPLPAKAKGIVEAISQ